MVYSCSVRDGSASKSAEIKALGVTRWRRWWRLLPRFRSTLSHLLTLNLRLKWHQLKVESGKNIENPTRHGLMRKTIPQQTITICLGITISFFFLVCLSEKAIALYAPLIWRSRLGSELRYRDLSSFIFLLHPVDADSNPADSVCARALIVSCSTRPLQLQLFPYNNRRDDKIPKSTEWSRPPLGQRNIHKLHYTQRYVYFYVINQRQILRPFLLLN